MWAMSGKGRLWVYLFLLLFILSCSKEESINDQSQYIIANSSAGVPILSIYAVGSEKLSEVTLQSVSGNDRIIDMILTPKGLFIILTNGIQLLNQSDWSVINSKPFIFSEPSYMAYSKGKLYVVVYENGFSYLRSFEENTLEEIDNELIGPDRVYAMIIVKNRIFISYAQTLLVLNADSFDKIGGLELLSICADLLQNGQGDILLYYENRCTIVYNSESKLSNFNLAGAQTLSLNEVRPSVVLDRETDIIYYFQKLASTSDLVLTSFDLRKNSGLSISPSYVAGQAIYFDQKTKNILLTAVAGNQGMVTVIDTNGKQVNQIETPGKPIKISFKFY